ncbi:MAG: hypothetical protein HYU53_03040 [Acidobacteria bacterium]|nr:hypothetical protein [Acidobacteriota bacterium]
MATGHEMEAVEITSDGQLGYSFRVLGDLEADAWELFRHLYANMRREMARRYVERTQFGWQLTSDQRLVGRIEWDSDTNGDLPLVVIDGKALHLGTGRSRADDVRGIHARRTRRGHDPRRG